MNNKIIRITYCNSVDHFYQSIADTECNMEMDYIGNICQYIPLHRRTGT